MFLTNMPRLAKLGSVAALSIIASITLSSQSHAQGKSRAFKPSTCLAVAQNIQDNAFPFVQFASFSPKPKTIADQSKYEVNISYQGHSTYLIETGQGIKIATDYAGLMRQNIIPDVVTMNLAHSSHYTRFPNPKITHVLPGWGENGAAADHYIEVKDVLIRNVTTDILRFAPIPNGNSIFIFEVAGLCIGHLGHLHHKLTEDHLMQIGRLDIVMVPVDGGMTLDHTAVGETLNRLRSSIVLPMHVRSSGALPRFLQHLGGKFQIERLRENTITVSLRNLPKQPTVKIMPSVVYVGYDDE